MNKFSTDSTTVTYETRTVSFTHTKETLNVPINRTTTNQGTKTSTNSLDSTTDSSNLKKKSEDNMEGSSEYFFFIHNNNIC